MRFSNRWLGKTVLLLSLGLFSLSASAATLVAQMDLGQLVGNADKIFRGTVISKEPGTVKAGGGELPIVTYTFRVDDSIKGDYSGGKPGALTLSMVGNAKESAPTDGAQRMFKLDMSPDLEVGRTYVLFSTPPSSAGLSTTVGLSQGLFRVFSNSEGGEMAANGLGNQGLFDGPVSYDQLKTAITDEMN